MNDNRPASFDARLMSYMPAIRRAAAKQTLSDPHAREDLVNDIVTYCLEHWQQFREEGGFYKWVMFCARDCGRNLRRRRQRASDGFCSIDHVSEDCLAIGPTQEDAIYLGQVLERLDDLAPHHATAVRMGAAGFTNTEAAAALGCSTQNVWQIRRVFADNLRADGLAA